MSPAQQKCTDSVALANLGARSVASAITLPSWTRHLTLTVPLSAQEYEWVLITSKVKNAEAIYNGRSPLPGEGEE